MEVHITHVFQQQTSDPKIPSLQKQPSFLATRVVLPEARRDGYFTGYKIPN